MLVIAVFGKLVLMVWPSPYFGTTVGISLNLITEWLYLCLNAVFGCLWQDSERVGRHNSGSSSKLQVSGLIMQPTPRVAGAPE